MPKLASPVRLLVLVPAYDPGVLLHETVRRLLAVHKEVWVLVDGSRDRSDVGLESLLHFPSGLRVLRRGSNKGKGATLLEGALLAAEEGFTHILTFDADGQHPPEMVPEFRALCEKHPKALIMGKPQFGRDAPLERVLCRQISNLLAFLETRGKMACDSLFGMRVYPLGAFIRVFSETPWARGYDFDAEIAVRMVWAGLEVIGVDAPVCYPPKAAGGVSHFHYGWDNLTLLWMHARLLVESLLR